MIQYIIMLLYTNLCQCTCVYASVCPRQISSQIDVSNKASLSSVNKCKQPAQTCQMSPRTFILRTATPHNPDHNACNYQCMCRAYAHKNALISYNHNYSVDIKVTLSHWRPFPANKCILTQTSSSTSTVHIHTPTCIYFNLQQIIQPTSIYTLHIS